MFQYANEDRGGTKRQARHLADVTVESGDTHYVMWSDRQSGPWRKAEGESINRRRKMEGDEVVSSMGLTDHNR